MRSTITRILFFGLTFVLIACAKKDDTNFNTDEAQRIEWIKDYAYCRCLTYSFGDSLSQEINAKDHSISTLIDIADLWSISEQLDISAQEYVNSIPDTQILDYEGQKPYMLRCLEYRRSQELSDLVNQLVKDNSRQ